MFHFLKPTRKAYYILSKAFRSSDDCESGIRINQPKVFRNHAISETSNLLFSNSIQRITKLPFLNLASPECIRRLWGSVEYDPLITRYLEFQENDLNKSIKLVNKKTWRDSSEPSPDRQVSKEVGQLDSRSLAKEVYHL